MEKQKILLIFFIISILLTIIPISASYTGNSSPSIDNLKNNFIGFRVNIKFNATTILGVPIIKNIHRDFNVPFFGKKNYLNPPFLNKQKTESEYNGEMYMAYTYNIYNKDPYDIILAGLPVSDNKGKIIRQFIPLNDNMEWNGSLYNFDLTNEIRNKNITIGNTSVSINNKKSGVILNAIIPDANSIASDFCRKNNLIFGEVLNESCEITEKSPGISSLSLMKTTGINTTDNNLDDGYDIGAPVNASIAGTTVALIIGLALVVSSFIILMVNPDILDNFLDFSTTSTTIDNSSNDQYTQIYYNMTVPDVDNLWEDYQDICNITKTIPTVDGFNDFIKNYYSAIGESMPNIVTEYVNNRTSDYSSSATPTVLSAFIESIISVTIAIIIIILSILGIIIAVRVFKRSNE